MASSTPARRLARTLFLKNVIGQPTYQSPTRVGPAVTSRRTFVTSPYVQATKWYYAVQKGREPGVYENWEDTKAQVNGFSGAIFQKFSSREAAEAAVNGEVLMGAVSSPERLAVYTDGSHSSTEQGGFGAYFAADKTPDLSGRVPAFEVAGEKAEPGSNNKSELYAVLRVLEIDPDPSREIHFQCDSCYVVEAFTGRAGAKPVRRAGMPNYDIILYIQHLIDIRVKPVKFFWVKGHAGIPGNVDADKLAAVGATLPDVPSRDLRAELKALLETPKPTEKPKKRVAKKKKEAKEPKKAKDL